jgi:hypothetical protein
VTCAYDADDGRPQPVHGRCPAGHGEESYAGRMPDTSPRLTIGQVAERTGLSVHALRFYEREGVLLDPVRRDTGGRRVYSDDDVE